ncbi:hypothetical protein ABPG72_002530 [Tetrahymena utriculariae]
MPKKLNELETKLHFRESAQNWLKLLKLEKIVIVLAHVAGCIYLRIGLQELCSGRDCWITQFKLNSQQTSELYLVSLYYMIICMVTIGYGDFFPTTMCDTIVSYIEWTQFLEILIQFPDDQEKILHLRDVTLYGYPGISKLKLKCLSCSSYDHQYKECKLCSPKQTMVTQFQMMQFQCLNSDYEEGEENAQSRSKSSSIQSNQSEKECISQSQAKMLQPDLKRNQSQTQKLIDSNDQFLKPQQNTSDIQDFRNLQAKMSKLQQQIESPSLQKNSVRNLSEMNYMQGRNKVQILSRKQKASTYNQISISKNLESDDQIMLASLKNSKKLLDTSPLGKRYSKTGESIIQQMEQQTLISPLIKNKKEKGQEDNQNENAQKKTPHELLLERIFKKRKRKASKLYQLKYQQVAERLAQKKQAYFIPLDENIQKNISDLLQKNLDSQDSDQKLLNLTDLSLIQTYRDIAPISNSDSFLTLFFIKQQI